MIVGCGSKQKDSESYSADSQTTEVSSGASRYSAPAETPTDSESKSSLESVSTPAPSSRAQEVPRGAHSGLSEAIKSQNEEGIYRAATQILAQNPNDVKALNALGVYYYKKSRYMGAQYFFSRAIKVQPASDLYNNMALTQLALGEKREGIKLLRKAMELNSGDGIAAANLGSIYVQEKDYAKARVVLETAVRQTAKTQKNLSNYGVALAAAGKDDSAKLMYEEALKLNNNSQETILNYAILLIEHLNLRQEGLQQLDRLRFSSPDETIKKRMNELENKAKSEIK